MKEVLLEFVDIKLSSVGLVICTVYFLTITLIRISKDLKLGRLICIILDACHALAVNIVRLFFFYE